jgi:hypothetical protein
MVNGRLFGSLDDQGLTFRVEIWTDDRQRIERIISANASVTMAQAAYDVAVEAYPGRIITLRHGARVIRETMRGPKPK